MSAEIIEETARILCDPKATQSKYERAILLFGLQIAAISPSQPAVAREARLHAAMKILEALEAANGAADDALLDDRLAIPDYKKVLCRMLARDGGWRGISRSWTRKEFADQIRIRWDESRDMTQLVDFSYRFAVHKGADDNRKGGVTMARFFVSRIAKISDGTLKARQREYGSMAVLAYVLRKVRLGPIKLTSEEFVSAVPVQRFLQPSADV